MSKRKAEGGDPAGEESDQLTIRPLWVVHGLVDTNMMYVYYRGAGQEVGRSCIMLEFKNKKIMVRYGVDSWEDH